MRPRPVTALVAAAVAAAAVAGVGAPSGTAAQRPPPFAESGVLTIGARGPAVRALQRELRSRGIPVAVDGRFGPGTRRAVARLQKRLGLRINGLVNRSLLWWLGISVCDLPGPTSARGAADDRLRLGAYGPQVCVLQRVAHAGRVRRRRGRRLRAPRPAPPSGAPSAASACGPPASPAGRCSGGCSGAGRRPGRWAARPCGSGSRGARVAGPAGCAGPQGLRRHRRRRVRPRHPAGPGALAAARRAAGRRAGRTGRPPPHRRGQAEPAPGVPGPRAAQLLRRLRRPPPPGQARGQRHHRPAGRPRRGGRERRHRGDDPARARPRRHLDLAPRRRRDRLLLRPPQPHRPRPGARLAGPRGAGRSATSG